MLSLSLHGVTRVASIDIRRGTPGQGWVTLQVAVPRIEKNSNESWQSITLFFEDLETGVDSFMEQLEAAYQSWQEDKRVEAGVREMEEMDKVMMDREIQRRAQE